MNENIKYKFLKAPKGPLSSSLGRRQRPALQSSMSPQNLFHAHQDWQLDDSDREGGFCILGNHFSWTEDAIYADPLGKTWEKKFERNIDWLPLAHPQLGTWPATQACALTGN